MHKLYNGRMGLKCDRRPKENPYTLINNGMLLVQSVRYKNVNINIFLSHK